MTGIAITAPTLATWVAERSLVILDARARLNDANAGQQLYRDAHIPGARHADMDRDLSADPCRSGGRHPLPDKPTFAARLRAWGITPEHSVVVYDDTGGQIAAARAWWMLKWAGHPAAYILDGGWQAWQRAGYSLEDHVPPVAASDWQPIFDDSLIASAEDVARGDAVVLDARTAERYLGESEPMDPKAGHIPGARNVPSSSLLNTNRCLLSADKLQQALPRCDDSIAYCGSGISACQLILAYAVVNRPLPRLYPGSWSAWSRDPNRPVATGKNGGDDE